ncbi:hypothetical protein Glove_498g34 [Diversispora epigaea]|uniref:Uncharacterized protein n=1 Tax=Diversispora epigaea TaxID=1348612 RepID=A0A397GHP1_9GLOM|nr:hypothetical protein Glove_498g34 [Diversispora epigaea]
MSELREKLSQYIGFEPEEIYLPITDEDKQLFRELITGGSLIHIMWVYICTEKDVEKVLIEIPPSKILSRKVLAHIEKRFKNLPLAPVIIVD